MSFEVKRRTIHLGYSYSDTRSMKIADRLELYDNSTNAGYQLIGTIENDRSIIYVQELPKWIDLVNLNIRSTNENF